jgi:hypothetical protein
MDLHRGQLEALEKLVAGVSVIKGSLAHLKSPELADKFEAQIVKAMPWKLLLGRIEFNAIVWRTIFRVVSTVPKEYAGLLADYDNGSVSQNLMHAIRTQLESLPKNYEIYIPMAAVQELHRDEVTITENIAIADAKHNGSLRSLIGYGGNTEDLHRALMGRPQVPKSIDGIRYLRISERGYGDDSPQSPAVRSAWSTAKQLIFVGMASGALVPSARGFLWETGISLDNNIPTLVVSQAVDSEIFRTSPGFELSQLFHSLKFKSLKVVDADKGLSLFGDERDATTGDEIQQAVSRTMTTAAAFLSIDSDDAAPVRAAMEWFVDAEAAQNQTVAFLQRCIGLEALLGSKESRRDVTERLADRYAYIVASTASSRDEQRAKFVAMYSHRSEVVHGRSRTLSGEHLAASWEARSMLLEAAWREMNNVLAGTRRAK